MLCVCKNDILIPAMAAAGVHLPKEPTHPQPPPKKRKSIQAGTWHSWGWMHKKENHTNPSAH